MQDPTNTARGESHGVGAAAPVAGALGATFLWSIGNMIVAGSEFSGQQLAFFRVLTASVLYQAIFYLRGGRMHVATFKTAAVGGLAFGFSAAFFFVAMQTTSVASATVIATLQPVLLLPYSVAKMGERVSARRVGLIVIAVAGTVVSVLGASSGGGDWSALGDLYALIGTLGGCMYFIGTKMARETLGTLEYQAAALPSGAVVAGILALLFTGSMVRPDGREMLVVFLLVLIPGSGHLIMSWAQKHLSVSTTSTITLNITLLSSVGAAIFFGQALGALQVTGMLVVVVALGLFVRDAASGSVGDPAEVAVSPGE